MAKIAKTEQKTEKWLHWLQNNAVVLFQPLTMYLTACICFYHSIHMHSANKWYINNSVSSRASFRIQQFQVVIDVPRLKSTPQDYKILTF